MAKQKKQHYVPQCLLKGFANIDKKFYIFKLLKNNIVDHPVPYKTQCYTDYLYGKDGQWESIIAQLETATSPIIQKLISDTPISDEEELTLKKFIVFQYCRTERTIDLNHYMLADMYSKIIPEILRQEGLQVPNNIKQLCSEKVHQETSRTDTAIQYMELAAENQESLNDLKLTILSSFSYKFISSDHPVIIENKYDSFGGQGLHCAGVIFLMPLSPQKCVLLYDDGIYDLSIGNGETNLTDEEVKSINNLHYFHSRELIYSQNITALQDIKRYFDSRYLDKLLRDIYAKIGFTDCLLTNIAITNLKKKYPLLIQQLSPKYFAKREGDYLPFLTVKKEFVPYMTDLNAGFSRFTDINDIPMKYYCMSGNYAKVIQTYLKKKKDKLQ